MVCFGLEKDLGLVSESRFSENVVVKPEMRKKRVKFGPVTMFFFNKPYQSTY